MANERAAVALDPAQVQAYLAGRTTLILTTIGPDGVPDPVPMWYLLGPDGTVRMRTYAKSQKVLNLRRDPRAACLVEDGERYAELRGVQLTGRIELVEDPEWIADVVAGLAVKYEGVAAADAHHVRAAALPKAAKQVGMVLHVERTVSWDHRRQAR